MPSPGSTPWGCGMFSSTAYRSCAKGDTPAPDRAARSAARRGAPEVRVFSGEEKKPEKAARDLRRCQSTARSGAGQSGTGRARRSRLIGALPGIANFAPIDDHSLVDADRKTTGRVNTGPDLVFERRPARTKIREGYKYSAAAFMTLGKIHSYRLLCKRFVPSLRSLVCQGNGRRQELKGTTGRNSAPAPRHGLHSCQA